MLFVRPRKRQGDCVLCVAATPRVAVLTALSTPAHVSASLCLFPQRVCFVSWKKDEGSKIESASGTTKFNAEQQMGGECIILF